MTMAIPTEEMAETLSVLAGTNASNAARHFGKQCFDDGDIASAILWTNIVQTIERMVAAPVETAAPDAEPLSQPVPRRMVQILEAIAFQDARFEDVGPEILAREEPPENAAPVIGETKAHAEFRHVQYGDASEAHSAPPRADRLEWLRPKAVQPPESRPIWSRLVKPASRRMAA